MKTAIYAIALWLLCGLAGELLLRDTPRLNGIVLGAITLGTAIGDLVER